MRQELQDTLYNKYPKIFQEKDLPMSQTCMCWGIEVGDGWYHIIDALCSQLQWSADKNGYPQVVAVQVKEKFGTLRFYYRTIARDDGGDKGEEYLQGLIDFAETMSGYTCDMCGDKGKIGGKGWARTVCDECSGAKSI